MRELGKEMWLKTMSFFKTREMLNDYITYFSELSDIIARVKIAQISRAQLEEDSLRY